MLEFALRRLCLLALLPCLLAAGQLRDTDLRPELAAKSRPVDAAKKKADAAERQLADAQATLKRAPDDRDANEIVGRRLVLRNEWQRALPHLAKAADDELRAAATNDLQNPAEPARQIRVADKWWDVADGTDGRERSALRARAVYWYSLALPKLTRFYKTRATRRIKEAAEAAERPR